MAERPVIIEYPDGRQYGIPAGAAAAKEAHPDAKIILFEDTMEEYTPAGARKKIDEPVAEKAAEPIPES